MVNTCGVGVAMQLVLTAEPIDAQRALQCNLVMRVVPHDQLMAEAELVARQVLRNSQRAVRSAKETILEVIGKPLDDQLRIEGWNSYTCVDRDEALALLERFYNETDEGRNASYFDLKKLAAELRGRRFRGNVAFLVAASATCRWSGGQGADLDQVVGEDSVSGPDPGSFGGRRCGCGPSRIRV